MGYRVKPFTMAVRDNSTQQFIDVGLLGSDVDADIEALKETSIQRHDTVYNMKADTSLADGMYVQTGGYYSLNDGGGVLYRITDVEPSSYHENLVNGLYAELVPTNYITPQMFGAYCDTTTNDAAALQRAVTYAHLNTLPVKITKSLYINSDILIPSLVRIDGIKLNEADPFIYVGSGCSSALHCTSVRNRISNIGINSKSGTYTNGIIGIQFDGSTANDVDSVVDGVTIGDIEIGVKVLGRNVEIKNSQCTHNRIGVLFDPEGTQLRGLQVENCRFHGIGEESALNFFENSYAIYITNNELSSVTIRNNIFDQSGCAFYGYSSNLLFENNFIESYAETPIQIVSNTAITPNTYGMLSIVGNLVKGKTGQITTSYTATYPEHLLEISNVSRINIVGNTFSACRYEAVSADSCSRVKISNCTFLATGLDDATRKTAVLGSNANLFIDSCVSIDPDATMKLVVEGTNANTLVLFNNANFGGNTTTSSLFGDPVMWTYLGTIKAQSAVSIQLPHKFLVKYGNTSFMIYRYGTNYTQGIVWDSNSTFYVLAFTVSGSTVTPSLRKYDFLNPSAGTSYASTMEVYAPIGS